MPDGNIKTADELISESLKRSPSYHSELGDKTVDELTGLANKDGEMGRRANRC